LPNPDVISARTTTTKGESHGIHRTDRGHRPGLRQAAARCRCAELRSAVEQGASKKGRKELSETTGFQAGTILEWVNRADLMRVRGVGSEYRDLLEAAGVDTVKELRNRNSANLTAKMTEVNQAAIAKSGKSIVRRVPAISMVERWVGHAKQLDPVVTH
jgi:predicted flap endonuclease-1-like 5' DNA nuclease